MSNPPKTVVNEQLYEQFCQEYVKDFRGGKAARRAGVSDGSARSWASRALDKPEVIARIEQLKAERKQRIEVQADDVVRQLAAVAFTDIRDLVEFRRSCCRHCWGKDFGYQRKDGELKAARMRHAKAVAKAKKDGTDLVDELEEFDEQGGGGFDMTRDPHPDCPECAGEGEGRPFIKDTRDLAAGAAATYAGVKVTKEGIEVKTHDPGKALELLGKHLGMFTEKVQHSGQVTLLGLSSRMRNRTPLA